MERRGVHRLGAKLTFDIFFAIVHQLRVSVAAEQHVLLHRPVLRKENAKNDAARETHDANAAGWPGRRRGGAYERAVKQGHRPREDEPEHRAAYD